MKDRLTGLSNEIHDVANYGLELAIKNGADEAKIGTSCSQEKRLVMENKKFSLANSMQSQAIGLIIHKNQKKGSATTNRLDRNEFTNIVDNAVNLSQFSIADDALHFPGPEIAQKAKHLDFVFDPKLPELNLDELKTMMREVGKILNDNPKIALDKFEMSLDVSHSSLHNSHGVYQNEKQTSIQWSWMGMSKDGDQVSGIDYDSGFSYTIEGALEAASLDAKRFAQKLLRSLNPISCPSYKGPIVISPRAAYDLLIGIIMFHASGRQVMDGKSKWIKRIGEQVLSPKLTLTDKPHSKNLMGATAYDGDGIPTEEKVLLQNGILHHHFHDCYSARKTGGQLLGMKGGPFGLHIAPGSMSMIELTSQHKEILYVDRFSGNTDPLTGDFSGVAKSSRLFVDGQDVGCVKETMIAGNSFDLCNQIIGLSAESTIISGSMNCPTFLVDGATVSSSS